MQQHPSFDDIGDDDEEENQFSGYIPFQFRPEQDSDEKTLEWLNQNFDEVYQSSKGRLFTYRRIANRYRNASPSASGFARESHRDLGESSDKPSVRTNFFVEYLDQKVTQVSKSRQNVTFIPWNDSEIDDLNNAEACNMLVKFRMNELKIEEIEREQDRMTFKYGHSFKKVFWDKCAGPVREEYKKAKQDYGDLPAIGEDGKEIPGKKLNDYDAKIGDVGVEVIDSDCIFPERKKKKWKKLDFVDQVEFTNIHELAAEYPDKDIRKEAYYWLDVDNKGYNQDDTVVKHYFYHRPTKYLPNGELIIYIESTILERIRDAEGIKKHMPDGELPFIPDTDIDSDDGFWAYPFLVNIEQHNNMYDLVLSGIARNIGVASHPKLLIAEGSVNLKQADNKYGVMQWRGPHKPEWMQHNYVNKGEFEILDRAEKRMDKAAKVYDISKGQVPTGITATSAMRLLDDQEIQVNSEAIAKRRLRVERTWWKVMKFMDANYKEEDGRMGHILGENNEYLIKSFKKHNFGKIYSVASENLSALSDTRSGRMSDIIDLNAANQKEPTFGRKEIIKLLDLGLEKAFVDEISFATTTAKTILEMLKHGETAMSPEMTDDLLEMYSVFSRFVESVTYKMKIKGKTKDAIKKYITGLEYLMTLKSQQNVGFALRVKEFVKFPMFFEPGSVITAAPPVEGQMPPKKPGPQQDPMKSLAEKANAQLGPEMEAEQNNGGIA